LIMTATDQTTGLSQLWHLAYPSGEVRRITNDTNDYGATTIATNGDAILTSQVNVANHIWLADRSAMNRPRRLTISGSGYDDLFWTRDNRILYIATESGDTGKRDIWMMTTDGAGRQRLTANAGSNRHPSLSADGRYIVFQTNRNGNPQVWRMDSDGRNPRALAPPYSYFPQITPDNQWVVYESEISDGLAVWKIPIDGGEPVQLTSANENSFALSPDGKLLAYDYYDEQKKRSFIAVKSLAGGNPIKIYDSFELPIFQIEQWTKEGLLCIVRGTAEVMLAPLDGKPPRQFTNFQTGERIYSFVQSPDGKQVAFSRGLSTYEAILITNFKDR
jgi:Tol biopolymer transport system component